MNNLRTQIEFHRQRDLKRLQSRRENPYILSRELRLARRILDKAGARGPRLVEIGCGEGTNLMTLRDVDEHADVVGLDFSHDKLACLREENIPAVCADAQHLPFGDNSFDTALLRDLLHHVNWAREEVLTEAARVVGNQGRIVILESNPKKMLNFIFRLFYPVERGMVDSTREKLVALASRFGEVEAHYVEASFLTRGLGMFLGYPQSWLRLAVRPLFAASEAWEHLLRRFLPKNRWTYLMVCITVGSPVPCAESTE